MSTDNLQQFKKKKREEFRTGHNTQNISDPASDTEWVLSFLDTMIEESWDKGYKEGSRDAGKILDDVIKNFN